MITMSVTLLLALVALQFIDWWTTKRILALGGYEQVWLTERLMRRLGGNAGLIVAKVLVAGLGALAALLPPWIGPVVLSALGGYYLAIIAQNRRVIALLSTNGNDAGPAR